MNPTREQVETLIEMLAPEFKLPADLCIKQCEAESSFSQAARSSCGAVGLFQLMKPTAKELGVNPYDWQSNVFGGIKYMGQLLKQFGAYDRALAAYNWGMGNLSKCIATHGNMWREHLPLETRNYLNKIVGPQ